MKIIDMKNEFIAADHVVRVSGFYEVAADWGHVNQAFAVFTSDGFRFDFVFDSEAHAKDCLRKLKSFLRNTNSMEDLFSIEEQSGYVKRKTRLLRY